MADMIQAVDILLPYAVVIEQITGTAGTINSTHPLEATGQSDITVIDIVHFAFMLYPLITMPVAGKAVLIALGGLHYSALDALIVLMFQNLNLFGNDPALQYTVVT